MATRKRRVTRRRNPAKKAVAVKRRKKLHYVARRKRGVYEYKLNPRRKRRTMAARKRKANPTRRRVTRKVTRRRSRRSNPGILPTSGLLVKAGGFFGGVFITKTAQSMIPAQYQGTMIGVALTGLIAYGQSKAAGMLFKNSALTSSMNFGGQLVTLVEALKVFAPSVAAQIPGLGLITSSNTLYPQVLAPGSVSSFNQSVIANMVAAGNAGAMRGLPPAMARRR